MRFVYSLLLVAFMSVMLPLAAMAGQTLDDIQTRDLVICGVAGQVTGFSVTDDKGKMTGLDVETCRAIAAATLGDANKVKFIPLQSYQRFYGLRNKEVDVLTGCTTWTFDRDTQYGISFTGINYYDGQGFMVHKKHKIDSVLELKNPRICIEAETTAVGNTPDYFKANGKSFTPVISINMAEQGKFLASGKCDAMTNDQSGLFSVRYDMKNSDDYVILPEVISKEPLGPAVRDDDDQWYKIVKWTLFAMINAEELGINSKNVDEMLKSENAAVHWLLGSRGDTGSELGLDNEWAYQIIKQVGNYGEVFERSLGQKSPLKIKRGLNGLWTDGGIMYAPPIK